MIIGRSPEIQTDAPAVRAAYEEIVELAPGMQSVDEAREIADHFLRSLADAEPAKVEACPELRL